MKNRPLIILLIIIIIVPLGVIIVNNQLIKPFQDSSDRVDELEKNITELQDIIEKNQTITTTTEITRMTGLSWLFLLLTIVFGILVLYLWRKKGLGEPKNRDQVIKDMRKYAEEHDGMKLFKQLKYGQGFYKGDHNYPVAVVLFSLWPDWQYNLEPPEGGVYGYLVDRRDTRNVIEDFQGMTINEVFEDVKKVVWGMRWTHYFDYKVKPEDVFVGQEVLKQRGLEQFAKEQADLSNRIEGYK